MFMVYSSWSASSRWRDPLLSPAGHFVGLRERTPFTRRLAAPFSGVYGPLKMARVPSRQWGIPAYQTYQNNVWRFLGWTSIATSIATSQPFSCENPGESMGAMGLQAGAHQRRCRHAEGMEPWWAWNRRRCLDCRLATPWRYRMIF